MQRPNHHARPSSCGQFIDILARTQLVAQRETFAPLSSIRAYVQRPDGGCVVLSSRLVVVTIRPYGFRSGTALQSEPLTAGRARWLACRWPRQLQLARRSASVGLGRAWSDRLRLPSPLPTWTLRDQDDPRTERDLPGNGPHLQSDSRSLALCFFVVILPSLPGSRTDARLYSGHARWKERHYGGDNHGAI